MTSKIFYNPVIFHFGLPSSKAFYAHVDLSDPRKKVLTTMTLIEDRNLYQAFPDPSL